MCFYKDPKLLPITYFAVVLGCLPWFRLNVTRLGFALEPQVNCVATDIKQLARLTFLETIQLNRFHYFLPKVITVRPSHINRVDVIGTILVYLLTWMAIAIVCDNLNTHNIASLYEAFPAPEAHRLARRLEIYHTPRNGSWLNVAEIELSILSKQCLARRIPTSEQLKLELENWQQERNHSASKVIWGFSTEDARVKLQHLYPVFEEESVSSNAIF